MKIPDPLPRRRVLELFPELSLKLGKKQVLKYSGWLWLYDKGLATPVCLEVKYRDLLARAGELCEGNSVLLHDVVAEHGQLLGNVRHMRWFREAVAFELTQRHAKWEPLAPLFEV